MGKLCFQSLNPEFDRELNTRMDIMITVEFLRSSGTKPPVSSGRVCYPITVLALIGLSFGRGLECDRLTYEM